MIRRQDGSDFLLIAQHDHALLAGALAEQFGNDRFASPDPFDSAVRGVSLHDCGWPLHDDHPTLNRQGLPLDVFEVPREIGLKVWAASAERAAAEDPYAGLLVSLHVLSLSVFASTSTEFDHEKFDMDDAPTRFAVIKFQQKELERQESLRYQVGLRTEKPTAHKLPHEAMQKAEDKLNFNFRMLQGMDAISLAACCTTPPMPETLDVFVQPGGEKVKLKLVRRGNDVLVDPWPFKTREVELQIPACRVEGNSYAKEEDFHRAFAGAQAEVIWARVLPGKS